MNPTNLIIRNFDNAKAVSLMLGHANTGAIQFSQDILDQLDDDTVLALVKNAQYFGITQDGKYLVSTAKRWTPEEIHKAGRDLRPTQVTDLKVNTFGSALHTDGANAMLSQAIKADSVEKDAFIALTTRLGFLFGTDVSVNLAMTTGLDSQIVDEAQPTVTFNGTIMPIEIPETIKAYNGVSSSQRYDMSVYAVRGSNGYVEGAIDVDGNWRWGQLNERLSNTALTEIRNGFAQKLPAYPKA